MRLKWCLCYKEEVKHSLEVKRTKMNDAFNLIRVPVKNVIETGEIAELKMTSYVKNEFEYVVSFSVFKKLLSSVDSNLSDNQVKILFRIIDFDSNELLSKYYDFFSFFPLPEMIVSNLI